jgi:Fur family ferric uptake transcriptional regulator
MSIEKLIKDKKLKLTTARKEILELLDSAQKPLSYEDMKSSVSMDKATFYRNITKFENEGSLDSFETNDKKRYFEIKLNPHAHFVCLQCNQIQCIQNFEIKLDNYEVNNIIINGTCPNCLEY